MWSFGIVQPPNISVKLNQAERKSSIVFCNAMTDTSLSGLGFILYQKDAKGHCSIVQVGSTFLKNAQARWHPAEIELLAIQYCLKNVTSTLHTVMM